MIIKCEQNKCGFYKKGCKKCESCQTKSHYIDTNCETCWNCENKQGKLRWGNNDIKEENKQPIMVVAR